MIKSDRKKKFIYWTITGVFLVILLLIVFILSLPEEVPKESGIQFQEAIKKDQSACDEITDESYQNLCHYHFTLREAVAKKDISLCDNLTDDFIKTCQDNYYFQLGQKEKDLSLCPKIAHLNLKKQCQEEVAALIEAEKLESQEGVEGLTEQICQEIEKGSIREVCQDLLAFENFPTPGQCDTLQYEVSRKICLEIVEKRSQAEGKSLQEAQQIVCNDIEEAEIQSICFDLFEHLKR